MTVANYYLSISGLMNFITCASLGTFVLLKNPKNLKNISFFCVCLSGSWWGFGYFFWQLARDGNSALFWLRILTGGTVFIPTTFLQTVFVFLGILHKKRKLLIVCYFWSLIFEILNFSPFLYNQVVRKYHLGFWPIAKPLLFPFLIFWLWQAIYGFYLLFKKRHYDTVIERKRMDYFIIAFLSAFSGIVNWALWYDIYIPPYTTPFTSVCICIFAYAIFRYQFMDINLVIKKGLVYSILVFLITLLYLLLVFVGERFLQGFMGYSSVFVSLISACIIALLFNPLRNRIQRFLDYRFFRGTLESLATEQERLRERLFQSEKLACVGQLASSIVHEIKNPLSAIKIYIQYLPTKYQDPEFKDKFEHLIPKEIERINQVVNQLLDLAKPRAPQLINLQLHYVINSTLSLLENNFRSKRISIKRNYLNDDIAIYADPEQLRQVFLNLFINAIDAMNEGGTLSITTEIIDALDADSRGLETDSRGLKKGYPQKSISKESASICDSKSAVIRVTDTGKGITQENLNKLFTPFFTTKREGTGLGLVVTQEIIQQHKGTIGVESEIGKGTTFILRFPIRV